MKKFLIFIFCFLFFNTSALADINYDKFIDYSKLNPETYLKDARIDMALADKTQLQDEKFIYLDRAIRNYYLVTKIDGNNMEANVGLAKCYEFIGEKKLALRYINTAMDIDKFNPNLNYYLGDYYYRAERYRKSLEHYLMAMDYGFYESQIELKLAKLYEKLADLKMAKAHYKNALRFDPKNEELKEKIRILDELKYENSQYYLRYE